MDLRSTKGFKDLSRLRKEPYRDWFSLQFLFVQVLESLSRVLPPVHADESTPPGRDQVDRLDGTELTKRVGQLLIADKLGQVSHPQSCTAHCKKVLSVNGFELLFDHGKYSILLTFEFTVGI